MSIYLFIYFFQKNLSDFDLKFPFKTRGHDFRKDFLELSSLKAIFPNVPTLALTATISPQDVDRMKKDLAVTNPKIVRVSPNRQNLYIGKAVRLPDSEGFRGYDEILTPIAIELNNLRKDYPMTIIYMNLKYLGHAYRLFERLISNIYVSEIPKPTTCLFTEFHSSITPQLTVKYCQKLKKTIQISG